MSCFLHLREGCCLTQLAAAQVKRHGYRGGPAERSSCMTPVGDAVYEEKTTSAASSRYQGIAGLKSRCDIISIQMSLTNRRAKRSEATQYWRGFQAYSWTLPFVVERSRYVGHETRAHRDAPNLSFKCEHKASAWSCMLCIESAGQTSKISLR